MTDEERIDCTCGNKLSSFLTPDPDSGYKLCTRCGKRVEKLDLNRYWYGQHIKWYMMSGNRSKIPEGLKEYDPNVYYKKSGQEIVYC